MLYCLEKADLDPLRKPKCQNLFNIRSLAVRALEVHGGLNAHNQIIYSKRKEDKDILDKRYEEMGWCDGEPVRRFSTYLEQYLKDWPVHEMGSTDTEPPSEGTEKRVLQYAPIRKVNDGEMWSAEIHWTTKIRGETPDD
ncbi:hypothetical protein CC2G_004120 [Coprinopsis cinerea AmutBmut pab1-1]|nr:hypothetical protein CC2G_004120 [Coprinopsis cinerea AmutBmut pab1-1]